MISILLATYNGEKYIKKTIESIINQTYIEWELLIGLNGCTDNTINIVNSFSDNRIKIFNYADKGKAITLNKLLFEASNSWICLIDDDDMWYTNKLEKQIQHIDSHDVIGTQMHYCDSDDNIMSDSPHLALSDDSIKLLSLNGLNQIANLSVMVKKESLLSVNGWNEELLALEDYDLWIRMIKKGFTFFNLNEKLVVHRIHNNSKFNTIDPNTQELIKNEILK